MTIKQCFFSLIQFIEKLLVSSFKTNTGYFYYLVYRYEYKVPKITYIICKGYKLFWINCYNVVSVVLEREDLDKRIKKMGVEVKWEQGRR